MTQSDLDRQIAELQRRHRAVAAYTTTNAHWWPTKAEEWTADMWRYDTTLVAVALLLELPVPPRQPRDATRRLSPPDRAKLERLLAAAGVDLA